MGSSAWQVVLWRLAEVTDMMSWRCGSVCGSCGSCYSSVTRRSYCNLFDGLLFTYIYIYILYIHTLRFIAVEIRIAHCQDRTTPCPSWTF